MLLRFLKLCVATLLVASCGAQEPELTTLTVSTQDGPVVYMVETAVTHDQMVTGLMNRQELRADSGMIFDINGQEGVAMWMKDTYIPLDMIFVNKKGEVIWLHENAKPLSLDLIRPEVNEPISAVIELNAGQIADKNIRLGDTVDHDLLKK